MVPHVSASRGTREALEEAKTKATELQGRLIILRNQASIGGRSWQDRGSNRARRDAAGADWGDARRQAERVERELEETNQLIEELESELASEANDINALEPRSNREEELTEAGMHREEFTESINEAYKRLLHTRRKLMEASNDLAGHERRLKVENADSLLEARNERSMALYLEGILDNSAYQERERRKNQAELAHYEARMEVERLELLVRLLEATKTE